MLEDGDYNDAAMDRLARIIAEDWVDSCELLGSLMLAEPERPQTEPAISKPTQAETKAEKRFRLRLRVARLT